ncbi:MAG: hypothetical protein AAF846_19255 [Chloroflexota bacterium]
MMEDRQSKNKFKFAEYMQIRASSGIETDWFVSHILAFVCSIIVILMAWTIINGMGLEVGTMARQLVLGIASYVFVPFVAYWMMMHWQRTALRNQTGRSFDEWISWNLIALGLAGLVILTSIYGLNYSADIQENAIIYIVALMFLLLGHFLVFRRYLHPLKRYRAYVNLLYQLGLVWLASVALHSDIWSAILLLLVLLVSLTLPLLKWTIKGINPKKGK